MFMNYDATAATMAQILHINEQKQKLYTLSTSFFISVHFFPVLDKSAARNDHFSSFTEDMTPSHRREFEFSFLALTPHL